MAIYNSIYSFEVFGRIKDGEQVFVLARQNKSVALVNDMDVNSAVSIVNADNKSKRYEFWVCEESEEAVNE